MGAPELPSNAEDMIHPETLPPQQIILSDDSEDSTAAYDGYQPLLMVDDISDSFITDNSLSNGNTDYTENNQLSSRGEQLLPLNERTGTVIENQLWNAERPSESIQLDTSRTQEILNIMANVSLPNAQIPDWARGIPEDCWKDQLLQQIRQRAGENMQITP